MNKKEYIEKLAVRQIMNVDDLAGETIKFIEIPSICDAMLYIVTKDGRFFIGDEVYEYGDREYKSRKIEFDDICSYANDGRWVRMSEFGLAIGSDEETCMSVIKEEYNKREEYSRDQRRLEYERLKEEFEPENK